LVTVAAEVEGNEEWSERKILALTSEEVLKMWGECPAVEMAELCGEYKGLVPNAGDEKAQRRTAAVMYDSPLGYWLGKSFCPLSHSRGDGYNRYRQPDGTVNRFMRFATEMGTSLIDGRPALMMYYGAYLPTFAYRSRLKGPLSLPEGSESTLTDEIRKLADGVYLGVGTVEMPDGTRSQPGHFVLMGPAGQWIGADDLRDELK
jgi:hypothetical protein|tara:strand:- start:692 stop:1303 length:612 start_codon:yes stop_codon:yes gene_type:complete